MNAASPTTHSTEPPTITWSGRRFSNRAEASPAKISEVISNGCTSSSGPNASAASCRPRPSTVAAMPISHSGRPTSRRKRVRSSGLPVSTSLVALACAALARPMQTAPATAAGTATNSDTPVALTEQSPHTIPIRRAYAV